MPPKLRMVCASRVLAECKIDFAEYAVHSSSSGGAGPNTAATATFRLGAAAEVRPRCRYECSHARAQPHKHTDRIASYSCAG